MAQLLLRLGRQAGEAFDLRPMLQSLADEIRQAFAWDSVALVASDRESGRKVAEGLSLDAETPLLPTPDDVSLIEQVLASGLPVVRPVPPRGSTDTESVEVCVPLLLGGQVVAALHVKSLDLGALAEISSRCETVAQHLAGQIAGALLLEETTRRATYLGMLAEASRIALDPGDLAVRLSQLTDYLRSRFALRLVTVVLAYAGSAEYEHIALSADPDVTLTIDPRRRLPMTRGVTGRALRTGEPLLVRNVGDDPDFIPIAEGVAAEFVVPIRFGGEVLGAFNFEASGRDDFTAEHLTLLRVVSDQVAGAIHLAALNERLASTKRALEEANRQLQEANQSLRQISMLDDLTRIPNRRQFDDTLDLEWRRAMRLGESLSILLIDIDSFKAYNDSLGHPRGDACLRRVAECLRETLQRAGDLVARYGGEEFAAILAGTPIEQAEKSAEVLRRRIEALAIRHPASPAAAHLTISVGVACAIPVPGSMPDQLVGAADQALYAAKAAGRNRVCTADITHADRRTGDSTRPGDRTGGGNAIRG